jgi:uncharacterized protein YbbK (DUF523 family)
VSECLGFAACRYDGGVVPDDFVSRLRGYARLETVCPEVDIGLGVPRDKIRLVGGGAERRLIQPTTGRDLTETVREFAARFLAGMGQDAVDGVILKSRSPSCGLGDCKVFEDWTTEDANDRGQGVFAAELVGKWPDVPVEDEVGLADPRARFEFLTRVFDRARRRQGWRIERGPGLPFPPELIDT